MRSASPRRPSSGTWRASGSADVAAPFSHRRRLIAGLATALAVGGGSATFLVRSAEAERREELASRRAIAALGTLVQAVEQAGGTGDPVREALRAWQDGQPPGVEARLVV